MPVLNQVYAGSACVMICLYIFPFKTHGFEANSHFPAPHSFSLSRICDLEHWVFGKFVKEQFSPTHVSKSVPLRKTAVRGSYHQFNRTEANLCMTNKRVWIIGDSYMRHFYFGLMDVLRGNRKDPTKVIDGRTMPEKPVFLDFCPKEFGFVRKGYLKSSNSTLFFIGKKFFSLGGSFIALKELLSNIIDDDLIVLNLLIHDNKRNRVQSKQFMGNMKKAEMYYLLKVKELSGWLKDQNGRGKFVWSTSNSYKEKKVPPQFRKYQRNRRILSINSKARTHWLDAGFPVLDVFHITMACKARTCTNDGSHYNQMVNRAKAQVLLNYFCQPPTCKKLEPSN